MMYLKEAAALAILGVVAAVPAGAAETDWKYLGGSPQSNQYSALAQIDSKNVASLGLLWYSDLPIGEGLVGNPLVADNAVYQGGPYGSAVATDIVTGKTLWSFVPNLGLERYSLRAAHQASTNRGLGIDDDNVYISGGCSLFGINRKTGEQRWRAEICDPSGNYGSNSAPRVGAGKVFVGINNMQSGTGRGHAIAFDAKTGKELWRFYTVPGDPARPFENKQMELAARTWGDRYWSDLPGGGSGSVWEGMIYDPKTDLLIFGAGNPGTDGHEKQYVDKEMLFTNSIIAVQAASGEYVWHRQLTTGDVYHPGDAVAHMQLADLKIQGRDRHVLLQAAKNGYFYVLDAASGAVISTKNYVPTVSYKPVDPKTGTLHFKDELRFWEHPGKTMVLQPGGYGAHAWELTSYNPKTGLVYIPAFIMPYELGGRYAEYGFADDAKFKNKGLLIAWDPIAQKKRWEIEHPVTMSGGVLSTGGNVVFQGTPSGAFVAYDATDGTKLWSFDTHSVIRGGPATVTVQGKQIVLVPSGDGTAIGSARGRLSRTDRAYAAPSRLLAFALGGNAVLPPTQKVILKPVLERQPAALADRGKEFYGPNCSRCHGQNVVTSGNGRIPDLRNIREARLRLLPQILRDGILKPLGMPQFPDITDEQIAAVRAHITNEAWNAYESKGGAGEGVETR
ncbi:outer membrane protein assembly factor BamB family protein [Peristeroidobacter soli]|uniref:outer membrane protein assembly factor BamB family protein n=1 Tax=Peristeroidobacter soli TaxID=2497877 RepID=UPI00101B7EBB|nr:PQQ-binding-like beta-propeller repeat protein [Peristeroidobacter soli]